MQTFKCDIYIHRNGFYSNEIRIILMGFFFFVYTFKQTCAAHKITDKCKIYRFDWDSIFDESNNHFRHQLLIQTSIGDDLLFFFVERKAHFRLTTPTDIRMWTTFTNLDMKEKKK